MDAVVIELFKDTGVWRLNQPDVGLTDEPLVFGMERILDAFVARRDFEQPRFLLEVSSKRLPELDGVLVRECEDAGGVWYVSEIDEEKGWLGLAALKLLFAAAPQRIFYKLRPYAGSDAGMPA